MRNRVLILTLCLAASAFAADKPAKSKPIPAAKEAPVVSAPAPAPLPGPFGVPDDAALARAAKTIKATFDLEYRQASANATADGLAKRDSLANRLYKEAQETRDDPAARYVLLTETRDWAAKAGNAPLACRAIEEIAHTFGVAPAEMTIAALNLASRFAVTPVASESLARASLAAADSALIRDDYDAAARLAAIADTASQKAHKIVLITDVQDKTKEINWARAEYDKAKIAIETLALHPEDKDARFVAGRFKCLAKNDWEHGLPLLIEGSDEAYKKRAERDLAAAPADAKTQQQVGEEWWDLGETLIGRSRLSCRTRAAHWYRKALPKLTGISRTSVEKRLEDLDLARLREMHLAPGLVGEYFAGQTFSTRKAVRIDPTLDFDWPATVAPHEALGKDDFSIRWSGHLRVPAGGRYTLTLIANQSGKVFIDDQLIIDEPDGTRKKKGLTVPVTLTEGVHTIRVDFWDGGGLARLRLLWTPPGGGAEEPIPAKFLVHELSAEK